MNTTDDRPVSCVRRGARAARRLSICVGTLAIGAGVARAQSPASDSVAKQSAVVTQDSATRPDSLVYRITQASRFDVKTSKAGLFGFAGHEHLVRARAFNGFVVLFPVDSSASYFELTVPAESLEVLTPPDTAEIRQVTETMRTEVLRVAEYPEIRVTATGGPTTDKGMRLRGELTLVGRTRPIQVDAVIQVGPDTIRASGTFSVKQTDFGIKPYSGGPAGTVKVGDRVRFEFDAIAAREPAPTSDRNGVPESPNR